MQVDGGAWLRLQRAGMMSTICVAHAVVASAIIRDFGASERQYSALAVYGLLRRLGGRRAAGRARGYRSGLAWFSKLGRCVCSTIGTGLCRNLGGVAVLRSGVASEMALFASPRTFG